MLWVLCEETKGGGGRESFARRATFSMIVLFSFLRGAGAGGAADAAGVFAAGSGAESVKSTVTIALVLVLLFLGLLRLGSLGSLVEVPPFD